MSQHTIKGKAFVLGQNIDTDQIIPAEHLVYSLDDPEERQNYGRFAMSGVPAAESGLPKGNIPLVNEDRYESDFSIIIGGPNFGCGSSREHAPAALQIAGVKAIVAPSYARIFYRNSVDGGYITPYESTENLSNKIHTGDELLINRESKQIENMTQNNSYSINGLGSVADIIEAGGIFDYARTEGMI